MWVRFMELPDGYAAATWKELFNQEALAVRLVPPLEVGPMSAPRELWVPDGKTHVAREVLNKI